MTREETRRKGGWPLIRAALNCCWKVRRRRRMILRNAAVHQNRPCLFCSKFSWPPQARRPIGRSTHTHTHTHTHRKVAREKSAFRCSDSCLASYTRRNKRKASAFNMLSVSNFKATDSSYHMRNMSPLLMQNRRGNEVEAHNNMATYRDFSWRTLSNVTTDH